MSTMYEPPCGERIEDTAAKLVALVQAAQHEKPILADFNGVELSATRTTTAAAIVGLYQAEMGERAEVARKKREAWAKTPEGIEAQRKADIKKRELEADLAGGLKTFEVVDGSGWDKDVSANSDGYGACGIRFAARWAWNMEHALMLGETVSGCADRCSRDADIEGITGFMYGCAVSVLARVWVHGEELRRWHNVDTQMQDEGKKANETGAVLNPALLSIGGKSIGGKS